MLLEKLQILPTNNFDLQHVQKAICLMEAVKDVSLMQCFSWHVFDIHVENRQEDIYHKLQNTEARNHIWRNWLLPIRCIVTNSSLNPYISFPTLYEMIFLWIRISDGKCFQYLCDSDRVDDLSSPSSCSSETHASRRAHLHRSLFRDWILFRPSCRDESVYSIMRRSIPYDR